MLRMFLLSSLLVPLHLACGHSQDASDGVDEQSSSIQMEPARYLASINLEHVADSLRGFSMASEVVFGLEENNRFVYELNAMGRKLNDVGKWQIQGDTLYVYDLGNGPNSKFQIVPKENGTFYLYGPNNFILRKEEKITGVRN